MAETRHPGFRISRGSVHDSPVRRSRMRTKRVGTAMVKFPVAPLTWGYRAIGVKEIAHAGRDGI
jgi:hypothetical protein